MEKKYFAESELIINKDGSVFHLHVRPEQLADKVILVGDPGRVALVASHFEEKRNGGGEPRIPYCHRNVQGQAHHGYLNGHRLRQH